MDQLRKKLQQIAREKILRSQTKNTATKPKRTGNSNKTKKTVQKQKRENNEHKIFFPKVPNGYFGYSRPREARIATDKEREQTQQFLNELNKLNEKTKNKSQSKKIRPYVPTK